MRLLATLAICTVVALTGCARPSMRTPLEGVAAPESVKVIAQVCFPEGIGREFREFIGVTTVTPRSAASGTRNLTGRTSAAQPVFEFYTAHPKDLGAVLVGLIKTDRTHSDELLFYPPKHIDYDSWSVWHQASAVAMENGWSVASGMVNGVKPKLMAVPPGSPVVRYRLMTFDRYLADAARRRESGLDANLPRCDASGAGL